MGDASRRARAANSGGAPPAVVDHHPRLSAGEGGGSPPPILESEPPTEGVTGSELLDHDLAFAAPPYPDAAALSQRKLPRMAAAGILAGVAVVVAVIVLNARGGSSSSRTHAVARPGTHQPTTSLTHPTAPAPAPTSPQSVSTIPPGPTAPAAAAAPAPAAATPGAGPELSSMTPGHGTAGQTVVVSGTNLISSDGQVLARFNGEAAGTSCSTPTSCTLTVPAIGGARSTVTVTVTTAAGTSNTLTFSYG